VNGLQGFREYGNRIGLTDCTDDEKASLIALMMTRRHEAGKRGKAATAFTAAVRQMYAKMMRATVFFDSSIIATARTSGWAPSAEGQQTCGYSLAPHM
jgi:hypothetical protein